MPAAANMMHIPMKHISAGMDAWGRTPQHHHAPDKLTSTWKASFDFIASF
jgi:hypothetical protein